MNWKIVIVGCMCIVYDRQLIKAYREFMIFVLQFYAIYYGTARGLHSPDPHRY